MHFDKCGSILLSFWCWNTQWVPWHSRYFQVWNCRRCGRWPCHKIKNLKILFPSVFVGDSQEFMKISRYTVHVSSLLNPFHTLLPFSLPPPPSSPSLLFSLLHWFYSFTHAPASTQLRKRRPQGWTECGADPNTNEEEFQLKLALFKREEDNLRCGPPSPIAFSLDSLQLPAHCIHLLYSLFEGHYRILSCSYVRNLGVALYSLFVCVHNRFLLPWYLRSWRFMSLCVYPMS